MDLIYIYAPYLVVLGVVLLFLLLCYILFKDPKSSKSHDVQHQVVETVHQKDYYKKNSAIYNYEEDFSYMKDKEEVTHVGREEQGYSLHTANQVEGLSYKEKQDRKVHAVHGDPLITKDDEVREMHRMRGDDKAYGMRHVEDIEKTVSMSVVRPESRHEPEEAIDATRMIPLVKEDTDVNSALGVMTSAAANNNLTDVASVGVSTDIASTTGVASSVNLTDGAVSHSKLANGAGLNDQTIVMEAIQGYVAPAYDDEPTTVEGFMEKAIDQYVAAFGILNPKSKELVREITMEAFERVELSEAHMLGPLLQHVVVEEALLCMQKAYVAMPTDWMKEVAIGAFHDVVLEPKSSTRYLVAFDALKILVHMQLGHMQVLAMTLLLQYSRNSNNYSLEYFRHYVRKYIEPFVSHIPKEQGMYQQLEYLHCTSKEQERISLAQLFSNSYPLVFNYRGFSLDELDMVLDGYRPTKRIMVDSINSSMQKLSAVDEGMAAHTLRQAGIVQEEVIERVLRLAMSKPVSFVGTESLQIFEHISPVLRDFSEIYNRIPMSTLSLTLLGLYLGAAHVKATIGEEFNLSGWL